MVTIYEYVIDLAIEIEDLMNTLYGLLVDKCKSRNVRAIIRYIMTDNSKHINVLNELKEELAEAIKSSSRLINKLKNLRNDLANTKKLLIELVKKAKSGEFPCTPETLSNYLIELERMESITYNFYRFVINMLPEKNRIVEALLNYIIEDEEKHHELLKLSIDSLSSS